VTEWIYHRPGETQWEGFPGAEEQGVLLYLRCRPFSEGFPPMSDVDWRKLFAAHDGRAD
jgi:hypothetical protein